MIGILMSAIGVVMLALGGFGGYEKLRADHAVSRAEAAETKLEAARQRATDLALLWASQVEKGDAKLLQQKKDDDAKFNALDARARDLQQRVVVVSSALSRLLRDASSAANAARAATGDNATAPSVPDSTGDVAYAEAAIGGFVTEAAQAYADAYRKWQACVTTYEGMRQQEQQQ